MKIYIKKNKEHCRIKTAASQITNHLLTTPYIARHPLYIPTPHKQNLRVCREHTYTAYRLSEMI